MLTQEEVPHSEKRPALEELQARPQWVCWRKEQRQGKGEFTKVPYNPKTGRGAMANNPETWASYEEAQRAYERSLHTRRPYAGLGYEFRHDYTGIDLDHCIAPDGSIDAWAQDYLEQLASYSEISPSGQGIHILIRGPLPGPKGIKRPIPRHLHPRHPGAVIELYDCGRFFTITGHHVEGTLFTIEERSDVLETLYAELTAKSPHPQEEPRASRIGSTGDLTDAVLVQKALAAKNGATFRALWNGDISGYLSPSEADQALCNLLAFWTGKDATRMDRLFRQSALYRPEKWDRPARAGETYGQGTITRAIAGCQLASTPGAAPHLDYKIIPFPTRRSAATPGMEQLGELPETELAFVLDCLSREEEGDAQLYAHLFRDKCLYDHTESTWYEWRGNYWERDACKHALLLASGPLAAVYLEASATLSELAAQEARKIDANLHDEENDQLRDRYNALKAQTTALIERARALRRLHRAQSVLTYAQALLKLTADRWDTHPWLLGTKEGTLDLRTGIMHPGQPQEYLRTVIPTTWRGLEEGAPRFEHFLQEIFADRPQSEREALIVFLQRALGYGITGHVNEHIFLMLYGEEGRNGKDTLMTVLQRVLGQVVGAVSNDVIIASGKFSTPGAAKPHLCALQGKRIAWASETDRGARFDVGQVKFLTGGGTIPARQLYGRDYTFEPSHLLILLTNHKPHADARDAAFWDRLCPILFNLRFVDSPTLPSERKRDTRLARTLEGEASGILAWLVRGCLAWQRDGLQVPASVLLARQEYRGEEDTLGHFLQECCIQSEQASVKAGQLYEHYRTWAQNNTLKPMTGLAFGLEMKKLYPCKRDKRGMCYAGIVLLEEAEGDVGLGTTPGAAQHEAQGTNQSSSGVGYVGFSQKLSYEGGQNEHAKVLGKPYIPYTSSSIENAFQQPSQPVEGPFSGSSLPYTDHQAAEQLLAMVKEREAGRTELFWYVPDSGFENGYLPREEYFRRLEACLASDDPRRREAALDDMKARLAR